MTASPAKAIAVNGCIGSVGRRGNNATATRTSVHSTRNDATGSGRKVWSTAPDNARATGNATVHSTRIRIEPDAHPASRRPDQAQAITAADSRNMTETNVISPAFTDPRIRRYSRYRAWSASGAGPSTIRMGLPVIDEGTGEPKSSNTVGATSTFATTPSRRVVSEVRVPKSPLAPNSSWGDPTASMIGGTWSPIRSIAADGSGVTTNTPTGVVEPAAAWVTASR